MSFKNFKASQQNSINELSKKLDQEKTKKGFNDDRYWKPTADDQGNGSAIIRFLGPAAIDYEKDPAAPAFVKYYAYNFKNEEKKRYYIERSRSSLLDDDGKMLPDPVMDYNRILWERGSYADKSPEREQARRQKRQQHFIANILVVKDKNAPENDGKYFLFDYGPAINGFINEAISPVIDDLTGKPMREAFDPFNYWTGADFYMRFHVQDTNKQRTYKNSTWGEIRPLFENDDKIESVHKAQYSLLDEIGPDKYKSYDELQRRLNYVLDINVKPSEPSLGEAVKKLEAKPQREVKAKEDLPWNEGNSDGSTFESDPDDTFDPDEIAKLLND